MRHPTVTPLLKLAWTTNNPNEGMTNEWMGVQKCAGVCEL